MAHMFVSTNLGESFMSIMEQPLDLTHIVGTEVMSSCPILPPHGTVCSGISPGHSPGTVLLGCSLPKANAALRLSPDRCYLTTVILGLPFHLQVKPNTPVLMCSVPGYDASGHVEDLAAEQNTQITSIAIGKDACWVRGCVAA